MKITTNITLDDYVYALYQKAATEMGTVTTEELMSRALFLYAGMVAQDILQHDENTLPS